MLTQQEQVLMMVLVLVLMLVVLVVSVIMLVLMLVLDVCRCELDTRKTVPDTHIAGMIYNLSVCMGA